MSKEAKFLIYCMERYRYYKNLSGSEVADLFEEYRVNDYIIRYFESLNTLGDFAIIEDIDGFIAEKKAQLSELI